MKTSHIVRYLIFITLGVLVLLFKKYYSGPYAELFYCYGSNFSISFAIYFIARLGLRYLPSPKLLSVAGSLLVVELFELTNGLGVMSNVYDPWDYLANTLGITLAFGIDMLLKEPPQE